jgi:hypothetical protein
MNQEKIKNVFKIQLINLFNDLLIVFSNDFFLLELKKKIEYKIQEPNFFRELNTYFCPEIEQCINQKDDKILFRTNYSFIPLSKEDILKTKLLNYWNIIDEKNKDKVWGYLKLLLQLYENIE